MSADVTPESLRALAEDNAEWSHIAWGMRREDDADALRKNDVALCAAADALEAAEAKLARVREWFTDPMEDEGVTWSRLEAILDDTEGDSR